MFAVNDRVTVKGPEGSAQKGKSGSVVEAGESNTVVQLDGESRPRNFPTSELKKEGE